MANKNSKNLDLVVKDMAMLPTLDVMVYYNRVWRLINEQNEKNEQVFNKIQTIKDKLIEEGDIIDDGIETRENLEVILELYHNEYNIRRQN